MCITNQKIIIMKKMKNISILLLVLPVMFISCAKNTIGSKQAKFRAIMDSGTKGHVPEYTYSTYIDNPKYFTELGEFWYASRNIVAWDSMNMVGVEVIKRYEQLDSIDIKAKRSVVEYVGFELFKDFLVDEHNEYAKNRDKSTAILYYLKKLKEYNSNNNPGKFLRILENIKPHIGKKDYQNLSAYYRST